MKSNYSTWLCSNTRWQSKNSFSSNSNLNSKKRAAPQIKAQPSSLPAWLLYKLKPRKARLKKSERQPNSSSNCSTGTCSSSRHSNKRNNRPKVKKAIKAR